MINRSWIVLPLCCFCCLASGGCSTAQTGKTAASPAVLKPEQQAEVIRSNTGIPPQVREEAARSLTNATPSPAGN